MANKSRLDPSHVGYAPGKRTRRSHGAVTTDGPLQSPPTYTTRGPQTKDHLTQDETFRKKRRFFRFRNVKKSITAASWGLRSMRERLSSFPSFDFRRFQVLAINIKKVMAVLSEGPLWTPQARSAPDMGNNGISSGHEGSTANPPAATAHLPATTSFGGRGSAFLAEIFCSKNKRNQSQNGIRERHNYKNTERLQRDSH